MESIQTRLALKNLVTVRKKYDWCSLNKCWLSSNRILFHQRSRCKSKKIFYWRERNSVSFRIRSMVSSKDEFSISVKKYCFWLINDEILNKTYWSGRTFNDQYSLISSFEAERPKNKSQIYLVKSYLKTKKRKISSWIN